MSELYVTDSNIVSHLLIFKLLLAFLLQMEKFLRQYVAAFESVEVLRFRYV